MNAKTYLDYAATTPLDKRVLEKMMPYFSEVFGNTSSVHTYGQQAEATLESAREALAQAMNCTSTEVIFTSCGTESDNLAIRGAALAGRARCLDHILISPIEHHAVSRTAQSLARWHGFEVEYLPVDRYGCVHPEDVAARLRKTTAVVSVIYANNEIGSINPIAEIGAICRQRGVPFHTDAVQAAAYLPVDVQELNVDLLSIGAHKFYGPKGVGALYVRENMQLIPTQTGGGQEKGRRAGTHNLPYIVGMAEALRLAQEERQQRRQLVQPLRDRLIGQVLEQINAVQLTGHPVDRLPNHASFAFQGVDGNALLVQLDVAGFACSSGSACKTGDPEPSDVLMALGLTPDWALGGLRVTLGAGNTVEEVGRFLEALPQAVEKNRAVEKPRLPWLK